MEGFPNLWLLTIALPALLSSVICYAIIIAHRKRALRVVATEDKRRQHDRITPLLGGVGILTGFLASAASLYFYGALSKSNIDLWGVAAAFSFCSFFGAMDDIYEIKPRIKLLGHALITASLLYSIRFIQTPADVLFWKTPWLANAVEAFWILGLLNSFNLIDGLDGLASGLAMIAIGFLSAISWHHSGEVPLLSLVGIAAIFGFFLWNRHPAKIFLGESGALAVACLVFLSSMQFNVASEALINISAPLFAVFIPIMDTSMAILRRINRRASIFKGDRDHIHYRFMRLGISHHNTVRIIHSLAIYLCLIAYQFIVAEDFSVSGLGLVFVGLAFNMMLMLLAEQKIYTYLTNFASHMLKVIDQNNYGVLSSHVRMKQLFDDGIPFVSYRLQLEPTVKNLLERSPGKIQVFFSKLLRALKNDGAREVFFESSESVLILQPLKAGDVLEHIETQLRLELAMFEAEEKVDLYLGLPSTLIQVPYDIPKKTEKTAAEARKVAASKDHLRRVK